MSLYAALKRNGPNGFGYGTTAEEVTASVDLSGKTYLITGANSGLGAETARVLVARGAHVLATARSEDKAKAACEPYGALATPLVCELEDPASVRRCVEAVRQTGRPLDGIIANAGVMALPELEQCFGYEKQFFTNHVGHFILVTGLLDQLCVEGRVVIVSSSAHKQAPKEGIQFDNLDGQKGYTPWGAYGQSKLANILFARELSRRLDGRRTANALHPGVIQTNLGRHMGKAIGAIFFAVGGPLFLKSIPQGAATQCYVATHPELEGVTGRYYADCNQARTSKHGQDDEMAARLWQKTEEIVASLPT